MRKRREKGSEIEKIENKRKREWEKKEKSPFANLN